MAKKEKKEKNEKQKKDKGKKNSSNDGDQSKQSLPINVSVCGHPSCVALYRDKVANSSTLDQYQVHITADQGTDDEGNIIDTTCDIFLCVYSVADRSTVTFLEQKVIPKLKDLKKSIAIAGLGLENRSGSSSTSAPPETAKDLGRKFDCKSMELYACDGDYLAAGTAALFISTGSSSTELDDSGDGKKKKKKKKDKKEKKEKKKKKKNKKDKSKE